MKDESHAYSELLQWLQAQRSTSSSYQRYDWDLDEVAEWHEISPPGVMVIEGVYTTRQELRDYYDLRVWVDTPKELRLARGVERDGEHARSRWEEDRMPAEERYSETHRSRAAATS